MTTTTLNLTAGEKIVVRSTDPRRDGYHAHAGSFKYYRTDSSGEPYAIVYDWCGMVGQASLEKCTVTRSDEPFRLY